MTQIIPALTVRRLDSRRIIVDFGKNLVVRIRRVLPGGAGYRIHIRYGEALSDGGELYTANLRTAGAHDIVVTGESSEIFEPRFTLHGFRYVEDYTNQLNL